ncbi:unnamed protein product [Hydatigera taeniaeformis]|uniref:ANTH domain-containing protein n=1 Tax=Hydatigena taeniaeformis TaxID=6205 RepID=A0A0R3WLT1_HYDTA|nr:unnamed protein product [Hydatigera taeniaeformis]
MPSWRLIELFNGVVLAAYVLLYKDLIRLYAVYNEAMINIIEKFFSMSKKDCQESLRIYKAFLKRMEHVNHFIKVAEACDLLQLQDGFGKQSLIFKPVPTSVLDALEGHLAHLEGKKTNEISKTSPTLSSPSATTAVTGDLVFLHDVVNPQNLSVEQQRIIEEERQRLEAFVSQARAKCPTTTPDHVSSGVDLLQLSPDATSGGGGSASKAATASTLFDDFFFEPALPASSSQMALSTVTATQPRPLSQFLSEPSSISAVTNPNNPFLPSYSSVWPATTTATTTNSDSALALKPPTTTVASDLDSRLAEIAGQLSVSNTNTTTGSNGVNWTGLGKPKQQQSSGGGTAAGPMSAATMNPWVTPGGVLQPTPVNNLPTINQVSATFFLILMATTLASAHDWLRRLEMLGVTDDRRHHFESPFQPFNSMCRPTLQATQRSQPEYALTQYPATVMSAQVPALSPHSIGGFPNQLALQPLHMQQPPLQQSLQFPNSAIPATTATFNPLNPFL